MKPTVLPPRKKINLAKVAKTPSGEFYMDNLDLKTTAAEDWAETAGAQRLPKCKGGAAPRHR